jgi:hypothetical protein
MFSTAVAVVSVLALVLPGFVIADLQRQERASVADESDWALVLRALSYSLLLHLAFSPWTKSLVLKLQDGDWPSHIGALIAYGLVVLAVAPVAIGLFLNGCSSGLNDPASCGGGTTRSAGGMRGKPGTLCSSDWIEGCGWSSN